MNRKALVAGAAAAVVGGTIAVTTTVGFPPTAPYLVAEYAAVGIGSIAVTKIAETR